MLIVWLPLACLRNIGLMEFGEVENEASYICDNCGEEIVVPLDITAGRHQHYVEDCPVCCSPNVLIVEFDQDGIAVVHSQGE